MFMRAVVSIQPSVNWQVLLCMDTLSSRLERRFRHFRQIFYNSFDAGPSHRVARASTMTTAEQNPLVFFIRVDHKVGEIISLGLSVKRVQRPASTPARVSRQGRDSAERRVSEGSRMNVSMASARYRWSFRHKVARPAK